jgi:hypothetical protein
MYAKRSSLQFASGHKILISRAIWPIGFAAAAAAEARIELQINCRRAAKSYLTCRAAAAAADEYNSIYSHRAEGKSQ